MTGKDLNLSARIEQEGQQQSRWVVGIAVTISVHSEALPIIMHAVELDPGDVLNEVILNQVRGPLPRGDELGPTK